MFTNKISQTIVIFSLVILLSIAVVGCGSPSSGSGSGTPPSIIKIGSLHPLTGALAGDGKQMDEAIQLAVDNINANGGIKSLGGAKLVSPPAEQ